MPSPPVPQHCPTPVELDDLELLTSGALGALRSFNQPGSPITLTLPEQVEAQARAVGAVELVDPEGLPLAQVAWPDGLVDPLTHAEFGPFRDLAMTPADYREQHAGRTLVPVSDPLTSAQVDELAALGPVTLLALTGTGTPWLSPVGLVRATRAAARLLPDAVVVTVPLAAHGDPEADHALGVQVAETFAAGDPIHALADDDETPPPPVEPVETPATDAPTVVEVRGAPVPDPSLVEERGAPTPDPSLVEVQGAPTPDPSLVEVQGAPAPDPSLVEVRGAPAPSLETTAADDPYPPEIQSIIDHDRPPPDEQGLVVFFTGLSGSGKSTLARALVDLLLEQGDRTVTSLDGDVVRRNLSAGLTFSKEDRETNIRRIGWVAAEISRHGGLAVVSPIAPFDETRQQVRAMVEDAGGALFLVHVATPLEECERRDRKGMYAKARAGLIPEFTGISSPYEEPQDADVRVDTTGRTIDDALHDVLIGLRDAGYLDLLDSESDAQPMVEPPRVGGTAPPVPGPLSAVEPPPLVAPPGMDGPPPVVQPPSTDDPPPVVEPRGAPAPSVSKPPQPGHPADPTPVEPVETPRNLAEQTDPAPVEPVDTPRTVEDQAAPPVAEVRGAPAPSLEASPAEAPHPATTTRHPLKVLFVCTANICRSPSVELLARQAMPDTNDIVFSSAGTHGSDGGAMYDEMTTALPADLVTADFRSRRLTRELLQDADLVLTMESAHRTFILDEHPELFRKVFTLGQFAQAVERAPKDLDRDALLAHVAESRGSADPALDVVDPYRQGPEAASGCVARLQELLRTVLPALAR